MDAGELAGKELELRTESTAYKESTRILQAKHNFVIMLMNFFDFYLIPKATEELNRVCHFPTTFLPLKCGISLNAFLNSTTRELVGYLFTC